MASAVFLAISLACGGNAAPPPAAPAGPSVDPATAGTVTATVKFEGQAPAPEMMTLDRRSEVRQRERRAAARRRDASSSATTRRCRTSSSTSRTAWARFGFPIPTEPVVLDQDKCRYTPRVLGVRVGQALQIRNSDPLLHNVRSNGVINQAFNKSTPIEGVSFNHTFATKEVMVPFKCDVHGWMSAYVGVLDHPYFGTTAPDGKVVLGNLPPGTYTIEAWHEALGTQTQQVTIGAKESKDVSFTFAR